MPYPEALVAPMREELTRAGFTELRTDADVNNVFAEVAGETTLLVINSVCGCAAANARPAARLAVSHDGPQPDRLVTVFAGQDLEATQTMRSYLAGIPPSSPFIALFKDGDPVYVVERRHIEGRSAGAIAANLVDAFEKFCNGDSSVAGEIERPDAPEEAVGNGLPSTFRSIL